MKTASLHAAGTSSGRPVSNDKRRRAPLPGCFVFERCRGVRGWMNPMDARSNDEFRSANRAVASLSLSLSLFLSVSLALSVSFSLREGSYLPRFDPRGVYDLPVQSAFFRRFLTRASRDISRGAGAFIALYQSEQAAGCLQDASITGSELHPGSLRTGPTVSARGKTKGRRRRVKRSPRRYPSVTLSAEVAPHHGGLKQIGGSVTVSVSVATSP